jgi:hypothetical protein
VVDVEKPFKSLRPNTLTECDAPDGVITHIILVVALAVEQFHADIDPVLLGQRYNALEAHGAIKPVPERVIHSLMEKLEPPTITLASQLHPEILKVNKNLISPDRNGFGREFSGQ